ncbi:glycerate kinase family protein [Pseudoneobacillus sp. C159]
MKFILAPDSFKESMTAKKAALAMEEGIRRVYPEAECVIVPMADGGEGTVQSLVDGLNGVIKKVEVIGPLGEKVIAEYGLLGNGEAAVIEMASASGLELIKKENRNPLLTTTYGTGELIKLALDDGVKNILIGIGGSATNDGGVGMLQALGVSFKDKAGVELGFGGGAIGQLQSIDLSGLDRRLADVNIEVACDVSNPLIGESGASYIFGPQKGATPDVVKQLDQNLAHFAEMIKARIGIDIANVEGSGAAGGLGAGLLAFLNAELKKGIHLVIKYTDLINKMAGADYVFTGEGSIDGQTMYGKTPFGVATVAIELGVPVIAFAGRIGENARDLYDHGFTAIVGILKEPSTIEEALASGPINLAHAAENVCRIIKINKLY